MQTEHFIIKYVSNKNCFVYLPEVMARRLDSKANALSLSHNENDYYVSWRPITGSDESLGISATFARSLNIKEGDQVVVSSVSNPPFLSSITVTPWKIDDWNIVEYQAERIQSILLDQISLVAKNQPMVVWISKGLSITLAVDSISPDFKYGKIGNRTEVHVMMPKRETTLSTVDKKIFEKSKFTFSNLFKSILIDASRLDDSNDKTNDIDSFLKKNNENLTIPKVFRVYPLSVLQELCTNIFSDSRLENIYDVFVDDFDLKRNFENTEPIFCKIQKIEEDRQDLNVTNTDFLRANESSLPKNSTELTVRLFVVEPEIKYSQNNEHSPQIKKSIHSKIYLSEYLRRNLKLSIGGKVVLETCSNFDQSVTSIEIFPTAPSITKEFFQQFISKSLELEKNILLNSRTRIYFKNGTSCMMLFRPDNNSSTLIDAVSLKKIHIKVNDVSPVETDDSSAIEREFEELDSSPISLLHLESIISECQITLELSLGLANAQNFRYEPGNILVCGEVGVGKTTLCNILRKNLQKGPNYVHVNSIECKKLKGKRAEAIQKIMSAAMADCIYYEPSILILDDLESITGSQSGDEEITPDVINASRILDVIFNISAEYQSSHYVSIIATCTNINKLGSKLKSPRGVHLFQTVLTIPDLSKEHRIDILKLALGNHLDIPEVISWDYYGNNTEGWVAQDLIDFAEKVSFATWKRHHAENQTEGKIVLEDKDLTETLKNYVTISLHGVQLYKSKDHDFSNIGGLKKVKETLTQLLKWPLQYPEFYRNSPIKNQNGVLLYGMPGTGKTIIAGAIAKECGVNLISVKGPELLSKYIGASEEAVRNIFEKARRAKPCVLFFDEFDSLAPRRGHDSTGVTDRVVNQLLTQLDGVEGREGVAVVAASSRPDLLDPALLRPGRLDKSLYCPLPDESDRLEILKVLCRSQKIDTRDLDLADITKRSSGFTGADLNAVLTQAKYEALENSLDKAPSTGNERIETIDITQRHLVDSINSTNPSLTTSEKEKYRRIYQQFSSGAAIGSGAFTKQKATLA